MAGTPTSHTAAGQALGYLYQVKWPLLMLLRDEGDLARLVRLEQLEDVSIDVDRNPVEALQLKHHQSAAGRSIGDADVDVWRTIRGWLDLSGDALGTGPALTLVTTAVAAPDSGMALLRPDTMPGHGRDVDEAMQRLTAEAGRSSNAATADTRRRWQGLSDVGRRALLSRVTVIDNSPSITEVDSLVRAATLKWLPLGHEDRYLERLWGWWYARSVDALARRSAGISGNDLRLQIQSLRDEYTSQSLPYDVADDDLNDHLAADHSGHGFYQQLHWVKATPRQIELAVRDYWRAVVQAHRWFKEDLVGADELDRYERRLREEWEVAFEGVVRRLPENASEREKEDAGAEFLQVVLERAGLPIRPSFDQPWFVRGKHHELADTGQVGWHPDFRALFEQLLGRTA